MEELKYSLFTAIKAEADKYLELSRNDTDPTEREIARQRYVVMYEQLEKCGFADEYNAWEWGYEEE